MFPRPAPALALLLAAPLAAQSHFRADLDGSQVVPPATSAAGGWSEFTLNADSSLSYRVETWGLAGTAAQVRAGSPGSNGAALFPLAGGPASWSGVSAPLAPADVDALRATGLYVEVQSAAYPGGEIRGQIDASPRQFACHCNGAQVTIFNPVPDTAEGRLTVNANRTITYRVESATYSGYSAHIHLGAPGVNGAIVFPLHGGPLIWSGTTGAMTPEQFSAFQEGGYYINVHHSITPGDEIRGQILDQGQSYGAGCGAPPRLSLDGAPMPGAPLTVHVDGGLPGSFGFLLVSLDPAAVLHHGCPRLVDLPALRRIPAHLDAAGSWSLPLAGPGLGASTDFYLQYGGAGGQSSNGLKVHLAVF